MIQFPKLKKLKLEDKNEIEEITKQHPPYSDFNFVSLFSWNIDNNTRISLLHGNLIIKMKDYSGKKRLYSFLGTNKARETIDVLCKKIEKEKLCIIKLVPKTNFTYDKKFFPEFRIKEDRNQFDYIYDLSKLSKLAGSLYGKKRNLCKRFEKEHKASLDTIDLNSKKVQKQILELFVIWKSNKLKQKKEHQHELIAIKRCFKLAKFNDIMTLGLYANNALIGFSINNILPNNYVYTVFEKLNKKYVGASEYFFKKKAEIFCEKGHKFLNYAQDLGIPGLRKAKKSWRPIDYLRKYAISKKK